MSEPISIGQPQGFPNILFRSVTPIFKYDLGGSTCFLHSGKYRQTSFKIEIKPYNNSPNDFAQITQCASKEVVQMLRERSIHYSKHFFSEAKHFLIIDV